MSLQYNQETRELFFKYDKVGECHYNGKTVQISLNFSYERSTEEWITPLSWFCYALSRILDQQASSRLISLEISCGDDEIEQTYDLARFLPEKTIKQKSYIWKFHKTDSDNWPSVLHGHEYQKSLKLDALNGNVYDAVTKQRCMRLKKHALLDIQERLRDSSDFRGKIE